MAEEDKIKDPNNPEGLDDYGKIEDSSVQSLFKKFLNLPPVKRINLTTSICLAKALSKHSDVPQDTKLEYLKEYGRNERAILKSDEGSGSDEEDPVFQK